MVFHVTAALAHDVLKLAFHVVKRVAQGNIPIFVPDPDYTNSWPGSVRTMRAPKGRP